MSLNSTRLKKIKQLSKLFKLKNRIVLIEGAYFIFSYNYSCSNLKIFSRTLTFIRHWAFKIDNKYALKAPVSRLDLTSFKVRFSKKFVAADVGVNMLPNTACLLGNKVRDVNNILSQSKSFKSNLKNIIYFSHFGQKTTLRVTGYFRRVWLVSHKKLLCLKIGKSFINKIKIPNKLTLSIVKRRLIKICSSSRRLIVWFTKNIYKLQPADPYRFEGIKSEMFIQPQKERFVNKKR